MINLEQNVIVEQKSQNNVTKKENLNFEITESKLEKLLDRSLLALKSDNILVYEPQTVLKKTRTSITMRAKSKIDDTLKVVTIYSKNKLVDTLKADRVIKDIFYAKKFKEQRIEFFQEDFFFFSVESNREVLSMGDFLNKNKSFDEKTIRFAFLDLIFKIENMHKQGYLHLNLNASNVGIDENGFIFLKNFKFVHNYGNPSPDDVYDWIHERDKNWVFVAPELLKGEMPSTASDYYSIGILFYYCLLKELPFNAKTMKECEDTLKTTVLKINKNQIPEGWSLECVDFINRLIVKEKNLRLGTFGGSKELLSHSWLAKYSKEYEKLKEKNASPIFEFLHEEHNILHGEDDYKEEESEENKLPAEIDCDRTLKEFFEGLDSEYLDNKFYFEKYDCLFDN